MKDKNGFTLVELLAVIVILGIVMLIGTVSIGNLIRVTKERVVKAEIDVIAQAGKNAALGDKIENTTCFSVEYLIKNNYYERKNDDINGSVLVYHNGYDATSVKVFLTDGNKYYVGESDSNSAEADDETLNMNKCPGTFDAFDLKILDSEE